MYGVRRGLPARTVAEAVRSCPTSGTEEPDGEQPGQKSEAHHDPLHAPPAGRPELGLLGPEEHHTTVRGALVLRGSGDPTRVHLDAGDAVG